MIRFACPACHSVLEAPDQKARREVPCPKCGKPLQIPGPPARPAPALAAKAAPAPVAVPVATPVRADPLQFNAPSPGKGPHPARRKPKAGRGIPVAAWVAGGVALFVAAAVGVALWASSDGSPGPDVPDTQLASKDTAQPAPPDTPRSTPRERRPAGPPKWPPPGGVRPADVEENPPDPEASTPPAPPGPTDNPVATFYSGPEGYPAWTDSIRWARVINMKTYAKGKTAFEKFEKARDELSEGGGVLYYPPGTYDFTTMPPGRGLMLCHDVVIRGEAPASPRRAAEGTLELPTQFVFPFRERGGGKVPRDWNFIGLQFEKGKTVANSTDHVGIVWVHLVGAGIFFGPEMDWGKTWGSAGTPLSAKVKKAWANRKPDGTHPFDALAGGGKRYRGAGKGRLVFGCVLEDSAVLDDFSDPGYGPDGFHTQRYGARLAAYGSRVLVANNVLPRSQKNFAYSQKLGPHLPTRGGDRVLYDYGKTCGIDVNKGLLLLARDGGACPGYFEEGVVLRDNHVFNHGHTGYNVSGRWVTITGNRNERAFLRGGDDVYGLGRWTLTLDGWEVSGTSSDNGSRAFDLAGRNLWVDGNSFNNTGSSPGNDGEGIVGRAGGTPLYSWAITHNTHARGAGSPGCVGGADVDCHGLLIGWNRTPGWVGVSVKRKDAKLADCAFVANSCERVLPDGKTASALGLRPPPTATTPGPPAPPTKVKAEAYQGDGVKITWAGGGPAAVGFRVERRIRGGKWRVIAYRPPRRPGDPDNPPEWVDFTAPAGKELTYRVVAVNADDTDKGASKPAGPVTLARPGG